MTSIVNLHLPGLRLGNEHAVLCVSRHGGEGDCVADTDFMSFRVESITTVGALATQVRRASAQLAWS